MSSSRHDEAGAHFLEARDLAGAARQRYLANLEAHDVEMAGEVAALLAADQNRVDVLDRTDALGLAELCSQADGAHLIDKRVGQFTIKRVIASGGMGTVYEATQDNPRRTVALKVMRHGLVSASARLRFEYEAQLLGRLQHPGIAQVFEAGVQAGAADRLPYFVMEYVPDALTLTAYAQRHQLSSRRRLELFVQVCEVVQYGHQQGVIHRDLKPGNILVDASGRPKVIDFGVARATDADLQLTTMHTDVGQLVGTVPYMSPEQIGGNSAELDTRSDVYALGVILYELLTGELPLDVRTLPLPEAARAVCHDEPTRLRARSRDFRGDLDTIAAKAIEKDKSRRYGSAAELADDIRRYLANQPITARPASTVYQIHKFSRRHRGLVAGIGVAFAVLIVAIVLISQALRGEQRTRIEAERARDEAQRQAAIAQAVNDFLNDDLLGSINPSRQIGREATVRQVLDLASAAITDRFPDMPLVEASVRSTLGQTYVALGEYDLAEPHYRRALALRSTTLGTADETTLISRSDLVTLYQAQRKHDLALPLMETVVAQARQELGANHEHTLLYQAQLALLYQELDRLADATRLYAATLEGMRVVLGPQHADTLAVMNNLASLYRKTDRLAEAERLLVSILEAKRNTLGPRHPSVLTSENNLAMFLAEQGRFAEAEQQYRRTLPVIADVLGPDHPHTLALTENLARLYAQHDEFEKSEELYLSVVAARRRTLGADDPETLATINSASLLYKRWGRLDRASAMNAEALAGYQRVFGEQHPGTIAIMYNRANLLADQAAWADAETLAAEAVRRAAQAEPRDATRLAIFQAFHGECLVQLERYAEAESCFLKAHAAMVEAHGGETDRSRRVVEQLMQLYDAWGRPEEAAAWKAGSE